MQIEPCSHARNVTTGRACPIALMSCRPLCSHVELPPKYPQREQQRPGQHKLFLISTDPPADALA